MGEVMILTGNYSAAYAAKAARVQVVAAYPITPQTSIVEKIAELIERGEMKCEYVRVESEHSAMAACIGASAAGARAFTATSAHGLAYMHEMLHWAAGARLPIVMAVINRAMGPPWNIWPDHIDSLSQRDTGWIQFYVESNQEFFDTIIQAYRVAEDPEVRMPAMVCGDGFLLSHTYQPVHVLSEKEVEEYLPPYEPPFDISDVDNPVTHGNIVLAEAVGTQVGYMEYRYLMQVGMLKAKDKIKKAADDFKRMFGRYHGALVEEYRTNDAEVVMVSMGTLAAQAKYVVDMLREQGYQVGSVKLRVYRPFPYEDFIRIGRRVKVLVVVDRNASYGYCGISAADIAAALYGEKNPPLIMNFIVGIGGRDVTPDMQAELFMRAFKALEEEKEGFICEWVGLKGD
ncbi:MAG: pyruvate ferredoxin oxidoreductase [Candidatus Baldrarchaeia archaeon]